LLSYSDSGRYQKFYDLGRESFLLDTESDYRQADREYQKVLALEENHGPTLAALAEMYTVWAQYLRDAEIDEKVDLSNKDEVNEADSRELERLHAEFEEKVAEAERWAKQALEVNPDLREAERAMAEVERLKGALHECRSHIDKAKADGSDPETDYAAVMLDIEVGKSTFLLEQKLAAVIAEKPLIRAMYRRARLLASEDKKAKAKEVLAELLALNKQHPRALALQDRIASGRPVLLTAGSVPASEEGQPTPEPGLGPPIASAGGQNPDKAAAAQPASGSSPAKPASPQRGSGAGQDEGDAPVRGGVDGMLIKAQGLQAKGQTTEALNLYKKVLETVPSNIDALTGVAYCQRDTGAVGQAIASFRRALGLNPDFGPALIGLADAYKRQGQKEQALKYYYQYLKSNPGGRHAEAARRSATQLEQEVGSGTPAVEEVPSDVDEPTAKRPINDGVTEIGPNEPVEPPPEEPSKKVIISPASESTP
jgi:tetratricopeptide (TPR) repeat protein